MNAFVELLVTVVAHETDVFALRRDGRSIGELAGLESQDQIRLATALSELGRDRLGRCGHITARFSLGLDPEPVLEATIRWADGPPPDPDALQAARRLVRKVTTQSVGRRGITVLRQAVPVPRERFQEVADRVVELLRERAVSDREEDLRAQTRDLIVALEEAHAVGEELKLLNEELEQTNTGVMALYSELSSELEQTNSGVVALHAELEAKSRQLRQSSEAKTRFWANVSHELRGPLNSVIGLCRLLAEAEAAELGEQQREQVALIAASGETLRILVDDLLDVAKAESGQLVPQPVAVDLGLVFAHLEAVMNPANPNPAVALVFPDRAALPALVTDETMLVRVLRNLVGNSLKFTEAGSVRVAVRADVPGHVEITVTDTGVGIPDQEQPRVFEKFYQVRGPHQRGKAGTGLGLPYARRLTELLGGTLALASAPGQGTRVTIDLPAGDPGPDRPTRLARLLSADDDPAYAAALRPLLDRIAQSVVQVADGAELLEAARAERPSAIVLDLDMPGLDGYETLRRLALAGDLAAVPVVVVSGFSPDQIDQARLGHASGVFAKEHVTAADLARAFGLHWSDTDRG